MVYQRGHSLLQRSVQAARRSHGGNIICNKDIETDIVYQALYVRSRNYLRKTDLSALWASMQVAVNRYSDSSHLLATPVTY